MNRALHLCLPMVMGLVIFCGCATQTHNPPRVANAPEPRPATEQAAWEKTGQMFQTISAAGGQEGEKALAILRENLQAAISQADQFSRQFSDSPFLLEAKYLQADGYRLLAQIEPDPITYLQRAETLTTWIVAKAPPEPLGSKSHLLLIITAMLRGDTNVAIHAAETFVKKYPHHEHAAEVQYFIADTATQLGQSKRAQTAARAIIRNYPKSDEASLAETLLRRLSLLGKPLADLRFTALDGRAIDIKDYRGKVVLIDFWATWCGPCRAELPNVIAAYNAFHDQGFEVIGISLDHERQKLEQYVSSHQMPWPEFFDGKGWENPLAQRFGIRSIPSNFLVDQKGKVVRTDLRGEALTQAVKSILAPKK